MLTEMNMPESIKQSICVHEYTHTHTHSIHKQMLRGVRKLEITKSKTVEIVMNNISFQKT